jgi:membrane protease YdiL (CAAX protease family)
MRSAVPPTALVALLPAVLVPALLVAYPTSLWPALIIYHAYCVLASFLYVDDQGLRRFRDHLSSMPTPPLVAAGVLLVLGELVARGAVDIRPLLPARMDNLVAAARPWRWFAAYLLLANGYFEERFWRGPMLRATGVVPGAAAFALMHAIGGWVLLGAWGCVLGGGGALVTGVIWGEMRRRYDSLWPCVLTHMALNAAMLRVAGALFVK